MRPNKLRQLLNEGRPSIGHHVASTSPDVVEIIGRAGGVDYVEFVAEYMPYDLHSLDNFGRALELTGMSGMIKVDQENKAYTAGRALGSGLQNILFSDTRTAEEARECVEAVRAETPQTRGRHGAADRRFAGYGLETGGPDYVQALEDSVVALMIEKREAVDNLEDILAVGGIDMIVFGANDYSMSIGKPGAARDPEVQKVRDSVFETALRMGVQPRAEIFAPDEAKPYLEMGVRHFAIGTDLIVLYRWLDQNVTGLRDLVEDA